MARSGGALEGIILARSTSASVSYGQRTLNCGLGSWQYCFSYFEIEIRGLLVLDWRYKQWMRVSLAPNDS